MFRHPGSKWNESLHIVKWIPDDVTTYVEPFFGSGAVVVGLKLLDDPISKAPLRSGIPNDSHIHCETFLISRVLGVFQYGLLHLGQVFGIFIERGTQVWLHRPHA